MLSADGRQIGPHLAQTSVKGIMRNKMTGDIFHDIGREATLRSALLLVLCLGLPGVPRPAHAADLHVVAHQEAPRIALARPDWPQPADAGQVFFLQRSMNANTVVYAARISADGTLDKRHPLTAYWRRFNDAGEVKPLKAFEKRLAYGVRAKKTDRGYSVRFAGLPQLRPVLTLDGAGQPALWAEFKGRDIRLISGYLELDESGMIPRVTGLRVHGRDPSTGREHLVVFSVKDGEIKQ